MGLDPVYGKKDGLSFPLGEVIPQKNQMMMITKKCLNCNIFCTFTGVQELQPDTWAVIRFACEKCHRIYDAYLSDGVPTTKPSDPDGPAAILTKPNPHDRLDALEL